MLKLYIDYRKNLKIALVNNIELLYYQEVYKNTDSFEELGLQFSNIEIDSLTIVVSGIISQQALSDYVCISNVKINNEMAFSLIEEKIIYDILLFAAKINVREIRVVDKNRFYTSIMRNETILIDSSDEYYNIFKKDDEGLITYYKMDEYELLKYLSFQNNVDIINMDEFYYDDIFAKFSMNLENYDKQEKGSVHTAMTIFLYSDYDSNHCLIYDTLRPIQKEDDVSECLTTIENKIDRPRRKKSMIIKKANMDLICSIGIIMLVLIMGIFYVANIYMAKDIATIWSKKAELQLKRATLEENLSNKVYLNENTNKLNYAIFTENLYAMTFGGTLGEISFIKNKINVLVYFENDGEVDSFERELSNFANIESQEYIENIKKNGTDFMKYSYYLTFNGE